MNKNASTRVSLLGVEIDRLPLDEFMARLEEKIRRTRGNYVVTPNVDHIIQLKKDAQFREIYRQASFVVPDGMPLLWVSRWLGSPLPERITGADLFPRLCVRAAGCGRSIFLLGATDTVCRKVAAKLRRLHPKLKISGHYSPPFGFEKCRDEREQIVQVLKRTQPDIVFAALGTPKQEKLIYYLRSRLAVRLFVGVGAALDFFSSGKNGPPAGCRIPGWNGLFAFFASRGGFGGAIW